MDSISWHSTHVTDPRTCNGLQLQDSLLKSGALNSRVIESPSSDILTHSVPCPGTTPHPPFFFLSWLFNN